VSGVAPVGREELLERAWRHLQGRGSVLVTGPPGAGRSTVVATLTDRAHATGQRVLRCAPVEAEAGLPFLALIDLLSQVDSDPAWLRLPGPWRGVLEAVGRVGVRPDDRGQQLAVRLAVLHLARALTDPGPVLLALDDLQWLDRDSAEVLRFVARRTGRLRHPLRVVAAQRLPQPAGPTVVPAAGCPPPVLVLELAPAPAPVRDRAALRDRLASLTRSARLTLLTASAATGATGATVGLLERAGRPGAGGELAAAARLGIVELAPGGVVRFCHPELAALVSAEATPRQRRQVHARLAAVATDPVERARHRAQAVTGADEPVAAALVRAARVARRRGAPAVAAELSRAAAERTPAPARAVRRLLCAATDALAAGHCRQARRVAESVLATATSRRHRVGAWLVLLDAASQALGRAEPLISRALVEAGAEPGLQAQVRVRVAAKALVEGCPRRALAEAGQACRLAARARDRPTLVRGLCLRATAELVIGRPGLPATLRRVRAVAASGVELPVYLGPGHLLARWYLHQDRFDAARAELVPLIAQAEQGGRVEDLAGLLGNLAEVEVRAGRCHLARQAAHRGVELVAGADLSAGPNLSVAALAEAAGGDPTFARALARRGVAASEADGDRWFLSRNLHALGYAALVAGDPAAAAAALGRVAELEAGMGGLDPALFRWHADLAEALVADRQLEQAAEVIGYARAAAAGRNRHSVLAALDRAEALRWLALREVGRAAGLLREAAPRLARLPLEQARAWHALGVAERRRRRRAAARVAFQQALALFEGAGALGWAARTRRELGPVDPAPAGRPAAGLTSIERRIARLVAAGSTNHQVATALSLSEKTVESYLTRIYRKLRLRSRVELAARLAGEHVEGFPYIDPGFLEPAAVPTLGSTPVTFFDRF
jgi:DNA-binding CsgD family transcriptional regulator